MCVYDRADYACGHQEWGPMKMQCTRYWRKCCNRNSHESFSYKRTSSCQTCQAAQLEACAIRAAAPYRSGPQSYAEQDIAPSSTLNLTLRLKPFPPTADNALHGWSHTHARPSTANHEDVKTYLDNCIKRYQKVHHLPEDSVKLSEEEPLLVANYQAHTELPERINNALQDYNMQIMLLEQQNKKRLMMAHHAPTAIAAAGPPSVSQGYRHKDYTQLARENQQAAQCRMSQHDKPVDESVASPSAPFWEGHKELYGQDAVMKIENYENGLPSENAPDSKHTNHAIEDYHMQLMLLEQQNKKRLMMARHEQDNLAEKQVDLDKTIDPVPMDLEAEQILEMEGALGGHEETHTEQKVSMPVQTDDHDQEIWSGDDMDEWDKVEKADELAT